MKAIQFLIGFALLALASSLASAYDPNRLQDICVAIENPKDGVFVNGKFCKDPKRATAEDFFFSGLNKTGDTSNPLGVNETEVNVEQIPGLNTLGVSAFRVDYAVNGQSPPHIHPRASEILLVLKGTLYAGFVTSDNLNHRLIAKFLNEGDVFVFPIGLIHFQVNVGNTSAVAYSGLNSQFPGEITIANTTFGADPPINATYLAQAFQLSVPIVEELQRKFRNGN